MLCSRRRTGYSPVRAEFEVGGKKTEQITRKLLPYNVWCSLVARGGLRSRLRHSHLTRSLPLPHRVHILSNYAIMSHYLLLPPFSEKNASLSAASLRKQKPHYHVRFGILTSVPNYSMEFRSVSLPVAPCHRISAPWSYLAAAIITSWHPLQTLASMISPTSDDDEH